MAGRNIQRNYFNAMPIHLTELELDKETESKIQDYLISWITYLDSDEHLYLNLTAALKDMLGISEVEFAELYKQNKLRDNLVSYLKRLKRYGVRGQTTQEIITHFEKEGSLNKNSVLIQLKTAKKWKEIKEITSKVGKHSITFYEAV